MINPEELEEIRANAYYNYLEEQSDYMIAVIFHNAMCRLMDKDCSVKEFVRHDWLKQMIQELDYTGEHDVSGFEDMRSSI